MVAGCNACEADLNVLATFFFDLARLGINFVASPRHADGVVVTGPISTNMRTATLQTYEAVPDPKVVIAVGSCTLAGGPFRGSPEITEGLDTLLPVEQFLFSLLYPHFYILIGVNHTESSSFSIFYKFEPASIVIYHCCLIWFLSFSYWQNGAKRS